MMEKTNYYFTIPVEMTVLVRAMNRNEALERLRDEKFDGIIYDEVFVEEAEEVEA